MRHSKCELKHTRHEGVSSSRHVSMRLSMRNVSASSSSGTSTWSISYIFPSAACQAEPIYAANNKETYLGQKHNGSAILRALNKDKQPSSLPAWVDEHWHPQSKHGYYWRSISFIALFRMHTVPGSSSRTCWIHRRGKYLAKQGLQFASVKS